VAEMGQAQAKPTYQIRELEFDDIFRVVAIIDAADVTDDFMKVAMQAQSGRLPQEEMGAKFFTLIFRAMTKPKVAKLVKEFVASLINVKPDELPKGLALFDLLKQIKEEIDGELGAFFKEASRLQKQEGQKSETSH
jgi:hypothetical protein